VAVHRLLSCVVGVVVFDCSLLAFVCVVAILWCSRPVDCGGCPFVAFLLWLSFGGERGIALYFYGPILLQANNLINICPQSLGTKKNKKLYN
jgi:hypothetical protein